MRNNPRMEVVTAGTVVAGRYRLEEPLGAGSTATVWRAKDEMFEREVAVKLVGSGVAANPTATRERLRREARAAARLRHRNVSRVLDYGEATLSDGTMQPFLVMELLKGESLAERLELGPMPWRDTLDVCAQVAAGLEAVHEAGMVHRDVKPGNVFLTPEAVKLLDFGIVATAWDPSMTTTGQVVGTPWYLAPERLVGRGSGPASDIYALGCVMHHTLTGTAPFTGDDFTAIAEAHLHSPLPDLPIADLPEEARAIHDACLAKNPTARPTAAHVSQRLRELLDADAGMSEPTQRVSMQAARGATTTRRAEATNATATGVRPDSTLTEAMPAEAGYTASAVSDERTRITPPRQRVPESQVPSLRQRQQTRRGPDATTIGVSTVRPPYGQAQRSSTTKKLPLLIALGVVVALAAGIIAWRIASAGDDANTAASTAPTAPPTSKAAQTLQRLRTNVARDEENGVITHAAGEQLLSWLNVIGAKLATPEGMSLSAGQVDAARQDIQQAEATVTVQNRGGGIGPVVARSLDKQLTTLSNALPAVN